jgi:hypothetical protein
MATDELGIVAVITLLIGAGGLWVWTSKTESALECVTTAARIGAGASPQDLRCPVSKKPFTQPVCPDSDRHLQWSPRFDRTRSHQDLPAAPQGTTLEIGRVGSYIAARENGPTVIVDVKPRFATRYLTGPLLQLFCILVIIAFFFQLNPKDRAPTGIIVMMLAVAIPSAWGLWATVPTVEGSYSLEFDRGSGKVVRHRYLFGVERSPEIYEARGLAFVRVGPSRTYALVLTTAEPRTVPVIDSLAEADAVLGSWLKARIPK